MSLEEIQAKFDEESKKLDDMREEMLEQERQRAEAEKKYDEETTNELKPLIETALQNGKLD